VNTLVLVALEAVKEDDKFRITATPQHCAPAGGASLQRKGRPWAHSPGIWRHAEMQVEHSQL